MPEDRRSQSGTHEDRGRSGGAIAAPKPIIIIRKKKKHAAHVHHGGSWKIAYADFVTAMMAFFLLLWLISSPDKTKLQGLAQYFSAQPAAVESVAGGNGTMGGEAVGNASAAQSGSPSVNSQNSEAEDQSKSSDKSRNGDAMRPDATLRVLAEELRISFEQAQNKDKLTNQTSLKQDRSGLRISLVDTAQRPMFRPGTADMYPYAKDLVQLIASRIMKGSYRVAIEGHTDGLGGGGPGNWKLSGDRAEAARQVLVGAGFAQDRIAEVDALAGTQPAYPDDPNRPENRRIVIVVLSEAAAFPDDLTFKR